MNERLVQTNDLPESLWCKRSEVSKLPDLLVSHWTTLLRLNNLHEMANTEAEDGFIGGVSKEDTDKHLAWRYNGSCGRVILSMLDPFYKLDSISDAFASIFAGGRVVLADLPCGSGAATIGILTALYELRKHQVLPRHRLNIEVVAGDISPTAREYYLSQLRGLSPLLVEQAIWVEYEIVHWDVLDKFNTADLINTLTLKSQNCDSKMLVLSNFSGFLETTGKWGKSQQQLDNLFIHNLGKLCAAIWIEPQTNAVTKNFLPRITQWFQKLFNRYPSSINGSEQQIGLLATANFVHPIKPINFPVRLSILRFDLQKLGSP